MESELGVLYLDFVQYSGYRDGQDYVVDCPDDLDFEEVDYPDLQDYGFRDMNPLLRRLEGIAICGSSASGLVLVDTKGS